MLMEDRYIKTSCCSLYFQVTLNDVTLQNQDMRWFLEGWIFAHHWHIPWHHDAQISRYFSSWTWLKTMGFHGHVFGKQPRQRRARIENHDWRTELNCYKSFVSWGPSNSQFCRRCWKYSPKQSPKLRASPPIKNRPKWTQKGNGSSSNRWVSGAENVSFRVGIFEPSRFLPLLKRT